MHETPADLVQLQDLLDDTYEGAGTHVRAIITPERRQVAADIAARLTGVRLLVLATVTADCRPLAGTVDGLFYRGQFWFGSSQNSVRFRHLRKRPQVSAVHYDGEEFSITVHGRAVEVDVEAPENAGFRDFCVDIYGAEWTNWAAKAPYARIDADKMFTFYLDPAELS
ncbi:MAG: pyridoxamine 5'-phosphate oxidase family protein [Acidimicrobiia bacterium]